MPAHRKSADQKYKRKPPGGLSQDPQKKANQLKNLERRLTGEGSMSKRWGRSKTTEIPGLPAFEANPTARQELIAFCRANTPAAFREIYQVMIGPFAPRVRLYAAELLLNRGWGVAPQLIQLKSDILADQQALAQPTTGLDGKTYAAEVYRILKEAGAVVPGEAENDDIRRDDATETIVEPEPRVVEEHVVVEPPPEPELLKLPPPRAFRRGVGGRAAPFSPAEPPSDGLDWLFSTYSAGCFDGLDMTAEHYRERVRPQLMRSSRLNAQDIVAVLDAKYAAPASCQSTDPLQFLLDAHREQRLDSVAIDREQYRVRVRSMLQRRPTNPAAREIITALDQRFA